MDYKKIYDNLIQDAINNPKLDDYKEKHHIVPICMGGSDDLLNLVKLTARQHYLAHWLLYKIHKTSSLVHAWHSMSRIGVGQEKRSVNAHLFEYCKKERSKILSEKTKGKGNNFYGKMHTDKTRKIISEKNLGKKTISEKGMISWIEKVAKKPSSSLQKSKLSERNKNYLTIQNKNTLKKLYIHRKKLSEYDSDTWVHPKKISPDKKDQCIHCGMSSTKGNIIRWHNDKCKRKNDENYFY